MKKLLVFFASFLLIAAGVYSQSAATFNALDWQVTDKTTIAGNTTTYCESAGNVNVSGGFLNLTVSASANTCPGNPPQYGPLSQTYLGSELEQRRHAFMYPAGGTVRVDSRMKLSGQGTHGAIWMLVAGCRGTLWLFSSAGTCIGNSLGNGNPFNEIDIMETCPTTFPGAPTTQFRQNLNGDSGGFQIMSTVVSDFTQNFHVYSIQWSAGTLNFLVDNVQTNTTSISVPHLPMYIMFGNGAGDGCATPPGGFVSAVTQVDYVRVCNQTTTCTPGTAAMVFDDEFNGASTAPAFLN